MTMAAIPKVPRKVTLCAIGYTVTVADGMVMFVSRFGPLLTRMIFQRKAGCWYVESERPAMTAHIVAAQKLIDGWFGDDHHMPRGEHNP